MTAYFIYGAFGGTPSLAWEIRVLIGLGVFASIAIIAEVVRRFFKDNSSPATTPTKRISLRDASIRLYSEALARHLPLAKAAEDLSGSGIRPGTSDDILNFMATNISLVIRIYGKRPPSTIPIEIHKDKMKSMMFKAGGAELYGYFDQSPSYIDLEIELADLEKHIDGLARGMEIP
jgi:hypothetical protein